MNKKLYFLVHIPRTSGSFIKKTIKESIHNNPHIIFYEFKCEKNNIQRNVVGEHITIFNLKRIISQENLNKIHFFTIVRNPYDRLYSLWKFFVNNGYIKKRISIDFIPENFEQFIVEYCDGYYEGHYTFQSQLYFLKGEKMKKIKIIKFEDREKINQFLECNGVKKSELIINSSSTKFTKDYTEMYNNSMKKMVFTKLKEEFDMFNYDR
jgi:hypothetical protein